MLDRARLLHEIALAFGANSGLRRLVIGLGQVLGRHLSIVEMELAQRRGTDRAVLLVVAPESGRTWTGERSSRVLESMRADLGRLVRCDDEVARVGLDPIAGRVRFSLGQHLIGVAFSQRALDELERADATAMLVEVLHAHTRCSSWLVRTAAVSQRAHRRPRMSEVAPPEPVVVLVTPPPSSATRDFADAQREAIAHALEVTHGKIYGAGGAAELLGLKPSTLQSKMRKLGLDRGRFVR